MRTGTLPILALTAFLLAPTAFGEYRGSHDGFAAGGSAFQTWGVIGAQLDDDTGVGMRYWRNTTGAETVFLFVTVCVVLDSGAGYCDRIPLHV